MKVIIIQYFSLILEKDGESPTAPEVPSVVEGEETPLRQPDIKARVSDPPTRSEIIPAAKRPLSRLVSGPTGVGIKARSGSSTVGLFQDRDALGSSTGDRAVVSARGPIREEPHGPGSWNRGSPVVIFFFYLDVISLS